MPELLFANQEKSIIVFDIDVIDIQFIFQQMRFDEEGLGINEEV